MGRTCANLMLHLVAIPALVLTTAYIAMDEETRCKIKECLHKKMKKEEKMIKECMCD